MFKITTKFPHIPHEEHSRAELEYARVPQGVKKRVITIIRSNPKGTISASEILHILHRKGGDPQAREELREMGGDSLTLKHIQNIRNKEVGPDGEMISRHIKPEVKSQVSVQLDQLRHYFCQCSMAEAWYFQDVEFTDNTESYDVERIKISQGVSQRSFVFARKTSIEILKARGLFVMMDSTHCTNFESKFLLYAIVGHS